MGTKFWRNTKCLCAKTLSSFSSTTMDDVSEMDYEKVKSGLEDKSIVLIDVRTAEERKEKHGAIPGSKHIWIDELPDAFKLDSVAFEAKFGFAKPAEDATIVTH